MKDKQESSLMNQDANISHAQAQSYWDEKAKHSSNDHERVEQSQRTQKMRFEAFVTNHDLNGCSILDVGCGVGDLLKHIRRRGINCDYSGFDISPEMVKICRGKFPGVDFECGNFDNWNSRRQFDYTIAIGIHNIKLDGARETLERVTRKQFEMSKIAAHISLLTDRYSGYASHILAWRVEEVLSMALEITPYVVLRHDYLPNDFGITLYREPLIDTGKNLILD